MRSMKYTGLIVWGLASAGVAIGVGCSGTDIIFDPTFDGSVVVDSTAASDSSPSRDANGADTSVNPDTGGADAGSDSALRDGSTGVDSAAGDTGVAPDAVSPDAGPPDVGVPDSGKPDSGAPDAGDAGTAEATYAQDVASAICRNLAGCCGGPFDSAKCITTFQRGGPDNIWQGLTVAGVSTGGHVVVNIALRDECLALIAGSNLCTPMSGALSRSLMAKCGGAVQGNVAAGGVCRTDIECVPGNQCAGQNVLSGVTGTCAPTSAAGQSCGYIQAGYNGRVTNCSTRGQGDSNLHCSRTTAQCVSLLPANAVCVANSQCQNQFCALNMAGTGGECADTPTDQELCSVGVP